jgi:hypothetical protein
LTEYYYHIIYAILQRENFGNEVLVFLESLRICRVGRGLLRFPKYLADVPEGRTPFYNSNKWKCIIRTGYARGFKIDNKMKEATSEKRSGAHLAILLL